MQNIEEIYKEYFKTVNKYLFCLTHNNDISEELTQETFYRAVKKINTYKGECKISVWLCQIAKNLWYDKCRRDKRLVHIEESELFNIQTLNNIEDEVISKEEKRLLNKKIQKLSNLVTIAGQITSNAKFDIEKIVRDTIKEVGYDNENTDIDYRTCKIQSKITRQSPDIALRSRYWWCRGSRDYVWVCK